MCSLLDILMALTQFYPQSVTQAPFAHPCTQVWLDDDKAPGIDTGL